MSSSEGSEAESSRISRPEHSFSSWSWNSEGSVSQETSFTVGLAAGFCGRLRGGAFALARPCVLAGADFASGAVLHGALSDDTYLLSGCVLM